MWFVAGKSRLNVSDLSSVNLAQVQSVPARTRLRDSDVELLRFDETVLLHTVGVHE